MGFLYIKKKDGERLGSYIQSIKNALYIGFHLNMNIKIVTNHPYTNKGKIPYIPEYIYINDSTTPDIVYTHSFLNKICIHRDIPELQSFIFEKNHTKVLQKLRENIKLPLATESASEQDLYIHMRSGDIFHEPGWKWDNFYIPPPLIFYYNVIQSRKWQNIYIICEDTQNLCLSALFNKYPQIKWRQQSLNEDIKLILKAKNIVYGGGTFVPSLLEFNKNVKLIYRVDYGLAPINSKIVHKLFNSRKYINALGGEFSNHPYQRYQMIHFGFNIRPKKPFRRFQRLRV